MTTSSPLDRETRSVYELVVAATDSGVPSRTVRYYSLDHALSMTLVAGNCHGYSRSYGCK